MSTQTSLQTSNQISSSQTSSNTAVRFSVLAQNIAVLSFGAVILFAVGFLPMAAAHNAAHDTRHAVGFPCH